MSEVRCLHLHPELRKFHVNLQPMPITHMMLAFCFCDQFYIYSVFLCDDASNSNLHNYIHIMCSAVWQIQCMSVGYFVHKQLVVNQHVI